VYLNAGREVAVASTKAFTSQVLALVLIAMWFASEKSINLAKRREIMSDIRRLPSDCQDELKVVDEQCQRLLPILKGHQNMFILGRDLAEPIADEGALKIKEIAYLHAQGYPGGSLKHGPFALIESGTPILLIMLDDEHANKIEIAAEEVKARGASTVLITNKHLHSLNTKLYDGIVIVPDNKTFGSLLSVIPLQYLAFKIAYNAGYSLDTPRNLCKTVNVDG
jgi:glucosamine--fructose-6-phosphate aminotransferase (isomerizing)